MQTQPIDVAALVRRHQEALWRYLRYLGCSASEAEDLAQETFLAVLRAPFEDRGPAAVSAYLRTAARRLLIRSRERSRLPISLEELDVADAVWCRMSGDDGGKSQIEALRGCIEKLDERGKRAITLFYRDDSSRIAIGELLGMSEDGVKSLLRRARVALRACVERSLGR